MAIYEFSVVEKLVEFSQMFFQMGKLLLETVVVLLFSFINRFLFYFSLNHYVLSVANTQEHSAAENKRICHQVLSQFLLHSFYIIYQLRLR